MHELDISIHRFEWILNLLQSHKKSKNEANNETIIRKLENFKILTLLYGKKVLVIKEALQNKLSQFLPIIIQWVSQQLELMKSVKEKIKDSNWKQRIGVNYNKALDVRSNILKMQNKNLYSQKNIFAKVKNLPEISLYTEPNNV